MMHRARVVRPSTHSPHSRPSQALEESLAAAEARTAEQVGTLPASVPAPDLPATVCLSTRALPPPSLRPMPRPCQAASWPVSAAHSLRHGT